MRVAVADTFVPPYRIPLYVELASMPGWQFKVFSCCETEYDRNWEIMRKFPFLHKFSFSLSFKKTIKHSLPFNFHEMKQVHLPLGLWRDLWEYHPDVVISAGMAARSLITCMYAYMTGKPFVIWAYSTIHTSRDMSWMERMLRKHLSKMPHAFIGMGREARQYLESLGVPAKSIFDTGQAVDHVRFTCAVDQERRVSLRHELGISGLCYLYVGRMIPLKGLNCLIDAWEIFCKENTVEAMLLLVGDGPEKRALMNRAFSLGLNNVKFVPFVHRERMPDLYHTADVFVLPTLQDTWAQVLGEAMASGLPVLCSKYDGSAYELIIEGQNGWIIDPLDLADISSKLCFVWDARAKKEAMGESAKRAVARLTYSRMADGIRRAVYYAVSKKLP